MAQLVGITLYPFKSLDGIAVSQAVVLPSGALRYDRQFALFDSQGQVVNGKRTARMHHLRADCDPAGRTLRLSAGDTAARDTGASEFHVDADRAALESWLSDFLELPVTVSEDTTTGFPDDTDAPGPTIVSTATLQEVGGWFGLALDDVRRRFRANLEVGEVPAFWEDRLFAAAGQAVRFGVGDVLFEGINPCQRCVVPSRSPDDGALIAAFAKRFSDGREQALPAWSTPSRFDHFYRLAVNTRRVSGSGTVLQIGDEIRIL